VENTNGPKYEENVKVLKNSRKARGNKYLGYVESAKERPQSV